MLIVKIVDKCHSDAVVDSASLAEQGGRRRAVGRLGVRAGYSFVGPTEQRFFFTSNEGFGMFNCRRRSPCRRLWNRHKYRRPQGVRTHPKLH